MNLIRQKKFFHNKHPIILFDYVIRGVGYVIISILMLALLKQRNMEEAFSLLSVFFCFFVWPHIAMLLSYNSDNPKKSEKFNVAVDSVIISVWITYLGFPALPLIVLYSAVNLNALPLGGLKFGLQILVVWLVTMFVSYLIFSPTIQTETNSTAIFIFSAAGFVLYSSLGGIINYHLINTNKAMKKKLRGVLTDISNMNTILQLSYFSSSNVIKITKKLTGMIHSNFFNFDVLTMQKVNKKDGVVECYLVYGESVKSNSRRSIRSRRIKLSERSLFTYVINSQEIVTQDSLIESGNLKNYVNDILMERFFILIPIILNKKCVGIAGFYSQEPIKLNRKRQEQLVNYINSFMLGVNNKRLTTEIEFKNKELNSSNEKLQNISKHLAKYVPTQLYDKIIEGTEEAIIKSRKKKLTIFFSDIVNFTDLSDAVNTDLLTSALNLYLDEMTKIALSYGATIDKYIGDAIMIFFGDPISQGLSEDACQCISMAKDMLDKLEMLKPELKNMGLIYPFEIRIGIHSGLASVGNFGSDYRMDYTAIGRAVNLASRMETVSSPNTILLSHDTYELARDSIPCSDGGYIKAKGFSNPIRVWRVIM